MTVHSRPALLEGITVIELSAFVAAPLCGLTLSQLGARVIRIDPPGGNMDVSRMPHAPDGQSLYWTSLNRGKASVVIDFKQPKGQEVIRRMLGAPGDDGCILVTNLALEGELDYESLRSARPDVIVVRLLGSPDGRREVDYTVNCAVGFPMMTGMPGQGPVNHVLPAWDVVAGLTLSNAVVAAVLDRRRTGRGALVTLALSDVAMWAMSSLGYVADAAVNGTCRLQDGNFLYGAYGDTFRTGDGRHVIVVAISDGQWRALLQALGLGKAVSEAAIAMDHDLSNESGRYAARDFISACLRPWFASRRFADVEKVLSASKALWGAYRTVPQMLEEDRRCSTDNPIFELADHPGAGRYLVSRSPLSVEGIERRSAGAPPRLGEDTEAVLRSMGVGAGELERLSAGGVIACATGGGKS